MGISGNQVSSCNFGINFRHSTLSNERILTKIFHRMSCHDLRQCRLVCTIWKTSADALLSAVPSMEMNKPYFRDLILLPVVDKVLDFLETAREQCQCRRVSRTFDYVAKNKVDFSPSLTDRTRRAVLNADPDIYITKLKVKDVYLPLPHNPDMELMCSFDRKRVKSLQFFEGVPAGNKRILMLSFPKLTELCFRGSTSFVVCQDASKFSFLKKLELHTDGTGDCGSLLEFLGNAKFPVLRDVSLDLYFRRDIILYFEAHHFIVNHSETLKNTSLKFCSKYDYLAPECLSEFAVTFTMSLLRQFQEVLKAFENVNLENLWIDFLPFEGTSLFYLSFALVESQQNLKQIRLNKDFTQSREELLPLEVILQKNAATLVNITIPHPYSFDCTCVESSPSLESLSIGEKSGGRYQMMFSQSDFFTVTALPAHIKKLKTSIRLTRDQVEWIIHHLQLVELYFFGHQADSYGLEDIKHILQHQAKLDILTFNCNMVQKQFVLIKEFCTCTRGIVCNESVYGEEEFFVALGDSRAKFDICIDNTIFCRNSQEH